MSPYFLRILAAFLIILLGWGAFRLLNYVLLWRGKKNLAPIKSFRRGAPAILYFTTPGCLPCKITQRPALESLMKITAGQVQLIEVDTIEQAELAQRWGVMSVPTTIVIDSRGKPRQVNHGVAGLEKLLVQLEQAEGYSLRTGAVKG